MADDPTFMLKKAREKLVEERRAQISNMVDMNANSFTGVVVQIQTCIEAIDRAIIDEENLAPSVYETRGLAGFDN